MKDSFPYGGIAAKLGGGKSAMSLIVINAFVAKRRCRVSHKRAYNMEPVRQPEDPSKKHLQKNIG